MNDEAALKLAAAIEKLAAAIEKIGGFGGGLNVYHHNQQPLTGQIGPQYGPPTTGNPPMGGIW